MEDEIKKEEELQNSSEEGNEEESSLEEKMPFLFDGPYEIIFLRDTKTSTDFPVCIILTGIVVDGKCADEDKFKKVIEFYKNFSKEVLGTQPTFKVVDMKTREESSKFKL